MLEGSGPEEFRPVEVRLAWRRLLRQQRREWVHKELKLQLRLQYPKSAPGCQWVMLQLEPGPHFQLA